MIEVTLTKRCVHECFAVYAGSDAVWRVAGDKPIVIPANDLMVVHPGYEDEHGCEECNFD